MDIKFLQINLQNSKAATLQVHQTLAKGNYKIALLQDAYVFPGSNRPIGTPISWRVVAARKNRTHTLINIDAAPIITYRGNWSITVRFETQGEEFEVTNTYAPPRADFNQVLGELEEVLSKKASHLLGGDYNAHSRTWGYEDNDGRGTQLLELMATRNLFLVNTKGSPPTFNTYRCRGWPDLTIASLEVSQQLSGWQVMLDEDSLSDHRYIEFSLKRTNTTANRHRLLTTKGRHNKFKNGLKEIARKQTVRMAQCTQGIMAEEALEILLKDLRALARKCYKEAEIKHRSQTSWWTEELEIEKKKLRAKRRRYQKAKDEEERTRFVNNYKKELALYKRKLLTAREKKWRQFCTNTKEAYGPQYKILGKKLAEPMAFTALVNSTTNSQEELMATFLETLFHTEKLQSGPNSTHPTDSDWPLVEIDESEKVTKKEVHRILARLRRNRAAGHDAIDYVLLKRIFTHQPKLIVETLNLCIRMQVFPKTFKEGLVVLFLKPGKDPKDPGSYRPVCLLPSLGKLLERVIQGRLLHHLDKVNYWSDKQFGFKWGLSTENALDEAISKLEAIRSAKEYAALVSFDFKGAFDSLWWDKIMEEVRRADIPNYIRNIIRHYLSDRRVTMCENGIQVSRETYAGCPQGSCLGPLLWNMVAETALRLSWSNGTHIQAYADDFALVTRGTTMKELQANTKAAVLQFSQWANSQRLTINIEKSKIMGTHAIRGVGDRCARPVQIGSQKIGITKKLKYLGITINDKLNWAEHCELQIAKVKSKFNCLPRYTGKNWGVNPAFIKMWYKTVAERILLYAAAVWGSKIDQRTREKLTSCQRFFLLACTRTNRTAPTVALQVLSGIMPITLSLKHEEAKANLLRTGKRVEYYGNEWNINDYEKPISIWAEDPRKLIQIQVREIPGNITIFTDGSKMEKGVGAALVVYRKIRNDEVEMETDMVKLKKENSVFQAELKAIEMAVDTGSKKQADFNIKTDSQSSILALLKPDNTNRTVLRIREKLKHLKNNYSITWVKAHVGTEGNERADVLAKEAIQVGREEEVKLPRSHLKRALHKLTNDQWQKSWDKEGKGRTTYKYFPKVNIKRLRYDRRLNQIYTGHGTVPEYLHRFKKIESPNCVCGKIGSWDHYIQECGLTKKFHLGPATANNEGSWFRKIPDKKGSEQKLQGLVEWLQENENEIQSAI